MPSDINEFLDSEGVVELMATVDVEGVRFKELDRKLGISHDTIGKRVWQGEELGILEPEAIRGERGANHKWSLTPKGARLHRKLLQMGAVQDYRLLQTYRSRAERNEEEFLEWVAELEEAGDLEDKKRNLDSLNYLELRHERESEDE